jgi:enoyl-CoA hydratase/carnithine racemase
MGMTAEATGTDVALYDVADGIATITLNRPDRLNAITAELEIAYFDRLEEASADPEVRVIVVTGAGRGFSAGADMDDLQGLGRGESASAERRTRPQTFPLSVPKPIVAAINGACAGLGFVWALMTDVRFAAEGAKFTTAFSRRGLIAEHGISWILPRLVGPGRSLDLLYSGRVFLADEAYELGLVNKVVPHDRLMDETMSWAADVAQNASPASMAVMKQEIYRHIDTDLDTALREANQLMVESFARPDFKEGVTSFVEKRPPNFEPVARKPGE